jgi:hypothetical protein
MSETVTIARRFQGVTGRGQGGHAAGLLTERIEGPAAVDFFNLIPIERPLAVRHDRDRWELVDGETLILRARPYHREIRVPGPATLEEAESARRRAPLEDHRRVPDCFSCGTAEGTMQVHAGPLQGRPEFATPWTPPAWTAGPDGVVLERYVWAAIDCPAGWRAATGAARGRPSVTGQMQASISGPILPDRTYALVAWADEWRGRRVAAGTSLYDEGGRLLASSQSIWISV